MILRKISKKVKSMKKLYRRFKTLNTTLKYAFIFSLLSIIIYKIFNLYFCIDIKFLPIAEFVEKLFYAIIGSTIFFFINQHIPRERKKAKTVLLLNWKFKILERDIVNFLGSLHIRNDMKTPLRRKEVNEYLNNRPRKMGDPVNAIQNNTIFPTHLQYFKYVFSKLRDNINETIKYSEYFDEEILDYLIKMNVIIEYHFSDLASTGNNTSINWHEFEIYSIGLNMYNLRKRFDKKYLVYLEELTPYYESKDGNKKISEPI